tara:strand:- start:1414 stop:1752 length:339 start_codon:yes stop_codon:yes gene_type:complete
MMSEEKRTKAQQDSIELLCRQYAEAFDAAGYDIPAVLAKKVIPVSWTQGAIKEYLFKAVMRATCHRKDGTPKESTTELNTKEVSKIHRQLDKWINEEFEVSLPFPDRFNRDE